MSTARTFGRLVVVLVGTVVAAGIGIALFWVVPEFTGPEDAETDPTPVETED